MKFIMALRFGERTVKGKAYYFYELNGKRKGLGADKLEARKLYTEVRKKYLAGKLAEITKCSAITLEKFQKEYEKHTETQTPNTRRANLLALKKIIDVAGKTTMVSRIAARHLNLVISQCNKNGLSKASINNYIRHAKTVFNYAVDANYISEHPFRSVKELRFQKEPNYLDQADVSNFISKIADEEERRMIVSYIVTGRRRSELLALKWTDINRDRETYRVRCKGEKYKEFPINSVFAAVLDAQPATGERVFAKFQHPDTISHMVKRVLKDAGYGHLRLHDLRHTFASLQLMQGKELKVVQGLMGHDSLASTQVYTHITRKHFREQAEIYIGPVDLGGKK